MSNKVQVIFTAECEQGDACTTLGFKVTPTTVSIQVNSDGLERVITRRNSFSARY